MKLLFNRFLGQLPQFDDALLPEQNATIAKNVIIERGILQPFHSGKKYREVSKPGDQLSLYRFAPTPGNIDSGWLFSWPMVVDCIPGPVAGNSQQLTYWTGEDWPRYTDNSIATGNGVLPNSSYRLGVPAPEFGPNVERVYDPPEPIQPLPPDTTKPEKPVTTDDGGEEPKIDSSTETDRDYVVTFVHQLGSLQMESAPSEPSRVITVPAEIGFGCQIRNIAALPSGPYPDGSKRLYRRIYAAGKTQFALVAELGADTSEYKDILQDAEIPGDILVSENYNPPLEDMHSLGVLVNGLLFGACENEVCISEPYLPHAWSPFARYPLPHNIVGTGQADSNIVAITHKNPYIIAGFIPANMNVIELKMDQGCLSKRSIASGLFGCVYASPDGLVIITGGNSRVLTDGLMTRDQWQSYNPASMITAVNEDLLIISYTLDDGTKGSMIIDPARPQSGIRFTSQHFTGHYRDGLLDSLLVFDPTMNAVALWDEGKPLTYTWRSRVNMMPEPMCFRCARVKADSYNNLSFLLYVDGHLKHSHKVTDNKPFRLPSGYQSRQFQVELSGLDDVIQLCIAESVYELE